MNRIAVVLVCACLSVGVAKANDIRLYTENFKPYQYVSDQGEIVGFGVELVTALFSDAFVEVEGDIRIGVWANVYKAALHHDNAAIFMTVRNEEREHLFNWVGPLAPREMWLYKLKDRQDISITTLNEAKAYLVGAYQSAQSDYLLELEFPNVDIVLKEELNIRKLFAGRIDLMPSIEALMKSKLKDMELPYNRVEKVVIFDDRFDYYLALNKKIPKRVAEDLQAALERFRESGRYHLLERKYFSGL